MSVLVASSIFAQDLRRCKANDPSFRCLVGPTCRFLRRWRPSVHSIGNPVLFEACNSVAAQRHRWLEQVRLDATDAMLLGTALAGNTELQTLSVRYGVYMTNTAAEQLERALAQSCVVRAEVFGRSYSHNGRRVVRDYQANTNAALRSLCVANTARRAIANDPALVEIDWNNMRLKDDDICNLAPSLRSNSELQYICLSNNRSISDSAVETLASALQMGACLRVDIDGCHRVSREAASHLRAVWVSNTCRRVKADDSDLAEIDCRNTEADDADVCMLSAALRTQQMLTQSSWRTIVSLAMSVHARCRRRHIAVLLW